LEQSRISKNSAPASNVGLGGWAAQNTAWKLGPEHVKLIERTRERVDTLHTIHTELGEKLFMFGAATQHMAGHARLSPAASPCLHFDWHWFRLGVIASFLTQLNPEQRFSRHWRTAW
jgi:hypothetical protein